MVDTVASKEKRVIRPPVMRPCSKNPMWKPGRCLVDGNGEIASFQAMSPFFDVSNTAFTRAVLLLCVMYCGRVTCRSSGVYRVSLRTLFTGSAGPTGSTYISHFLTRSTESSLLSMSRGTWFTQEIWASMNWVRYLAADGMANAYVAVNVPMLSFNVSTMS